MRAGFPLAKIGLMESMSTKLVVFVLVSVVWLGVWPCQVLADGAIGSSGVGSYGGSGIDAPAVSSSRVLVAYNLARGSGTVIQVDLWYTRDKGHRWELAPVSESPASPIAFDAGQDGLYGFYLVLHNEAGASSMPPGPGSAPQQWVLVDRSAPTVQVLTLRPDASFSENREILIRWVGRDDNLLNRPVSLHYRTAETKSYQLIADSLAAESSYRWTVPEGVTGRVEIKISVSDRAGNVGRYVADWLRIEGGRPVTGHAPTASAEGEETVGDQQDPQFGPDSIAEIRRRPRDAQPGRTPGGDGMHLVQGYGEPDAGKTSAASSEAEKRALRRYELGTWHRMRGEYKLAAIRYREAARLDPDFLAAGHDLGAVLLMTGDQKGAERAFRAVLKKDPKHSGALRSLALAQASQQQYKSSAETLGTLLKVAPEDAEAWLSLGDVKLFMGKRAEAQETWHRVLAMETAPKEIKERARKRLAMYQRAVITGRTAAAEQPD